MANSAHRKKVYLDSRCRGTCIYQLARESCEQEKGDWGERVPWGGGKGGR